MYDICNLFTQQMSANFTEHRCFKLGTIFVHIIALHPNLHSVGRNSFQHFSHFGTRSEEQQMLDPSLAHLPNVFNRDSQFRSSLRHLRVIRSPVELQG